MKDLYNKLINYTPQNEVEDHVKDELIEMIEANTPGEHGDEQVLIGIDNLIGCTYEDIICEGDLPEYYMPIEVIKFFYKLVTNP